MNKYCYQCDAELEQTFVDGINIEPIYYFCVKCNNFQSIFYTDDEKSIIKDLRYTLPSHLFWVIPSLIFIFRKYMKNAT